MSIDAAYRYPERRYTKEQYEKAKSVDLVEFFNSKGFEMIRKGRYYQSKINDSLVIKYITDKPSWHWNSRGMHGSSAISFLTQYENMDLDDAVITLAGGSYAAFSISERSRKERVPFILPEVNPTNRRVFDYLTKKRCLDQEVVGEMMNQGRIYESAPYHNCVFLGFSPEGEVAFATERGTFDRRGQKPYRNEIKGSADEYRFVMEGAGDTLYICEAPIDCMSHAGLYKMQGIDWRKDTRLGLCGNCDIALQGYLKHHPEIGRLIWAVDNDQGGQIAIDRYFRKYTDLGYESYRQTPQTKDWNQDIQELFNPPQAEEQEEPEYE